MSEEDVKKSKEKKPDLGKMFIERVRDRVRFWKTPKGQAYGDFPHRGQLHAWPIDSGEAESWFYNEWIVMFGTVPPMFTMTPALKYFMSQGVLSDEIHDPALRVKRTDDGNIYVDLATPAGDIVEIKPGSWSLKKKNGIKFILGSGELPQMIPDPSGDIHLLKKYLPPMTDMEYKLMLSWLIGAYTAHDGFPVLVLSGGPGTAKSSVTTFLKKLVDPNDDNSATPPKDAGDIASMIKKSYVVYIDNISTIPGWLSDQLCRLTAGDSSIGGRKLYTNHGDASFKAKRPVLLAGIPQFVERADLMDRCISIELQTIKEEDRKVWEDFVVEFDKDRPKILGGIFNVIAQAMLDRPTVKPTKLPRLAGFGKTMWAAEKHLGWEPGEFQRIWDSNTEEKSQEIIGASPVAQALEIVFKNLEEQNHELILRGTVTAIYNKLVMASDNPSKLPQRAKDLIPLMRNLQPALASQGILWYKNDKRTKDGYLWEIRKKA
jgi:putative DNA primase/helicase